MNPSSLLEGERFRKLMIFSVRLKDQNSNLKFRRLLRDKLNGAVKSKAAGDKNLLIGLMYLNGLLQKIVFSELNLAFHEMKLEFKDMADLALLLQIFVPDDKCPHYLFLEKITPLLLSASLDIKKNSQQANALSYMKNVLTLTRQIIDEL